jgi:type I restriction enzyme S subunit
MNNWKNIKISEFANTQSGGTPSTSRDDFWNGDVPWINSGELKDCKISKASKYITKLGLASSSARLFPKGTVVIALTGATTAKLGLLEIETSTNQSITGIIPNNNYDPFFLFYQLLSLRREILSKSLGTAQPHINKRIVDEIIVKLAPLPEQQAIVAKIEELLSELENGKQQLLTAQQQLKVYRQSLLKWAFVTTKFNDFVMKEVTEKIQIGPFGTQLHKEDYITNGIPLINPMHIQDGNIQPNFSYSITKQKRDSLPNYILQEGDVIMGRRGEMGRCGLVRKKEIGWFCGTGSLYFRPQSKRLNSLFLYYYLCSQTVKKYLDENAGGTTMANLNLKIVNDIPISLPSLKEQQFIVDELESKLTVCDKIDETISQSLQQAETLKQSILKQAFEGKLI